MRRFLLITDVTRFQRLECRCVAGLTPEGICIRPMSDYLDAEECDALNILPGAVITGEFRPSQEAAAPHTEDHHHENIEFVRYSEIRELEAMLGRTAADRVEQEGSGFDSRLDDTGRFFPEENPPSRSIITLAVQPERFSLVFCPHRDKPWRARFEDASGRCFEELPITDHHFSSYLERLEPDAILNDLNEALHGQDMLFLRLGLGRLFESKGRTGYWLQVNAIHTFPTWPARTRRHLDGNVVESTGCRRSTP